MLRQSLVLIVLILLIPVSSPAYRDRGSWKKTLEDKATFFERNSAERHNIEGSYPSSIRLHPPDHYVDPSLGNWKTLTETGELPPGWWFDHGTSGISNVAHTSSWTGCLLTAKAFHVAFLRDRYGTDDPRYKEAYARANEIIRSLRILTRVSGKPGYLARGIALGHGVSYEERARSDTRDLWKQGVGELSHYRYRGGPSHHNYDQVFRGLGIYYFVAADAVQKERIKEIVSDMSDWAHIRKNMRVMHDDGERESTVLIGGWRGMEGDKEPSGGSLMATTGLKIAAMITGNPKVAELYEEWVDRLGYRDPDRTKESVMGRPRGNYDDTDHLLPDLYLLIMIEDDPDLLDFYRKCVKDSWEAHKDEKMSWFNFLYAAVLGEEYVDLEGSLWNLQTFPTCRMFQPQMNSIRTDIEFTEEEGRKEALHPLPVHERRSDNEYEWKGSPFGLDGWLSRTVSVVEISPHDPFVQFAADTSGGSYLSLDKGEMWRATDGLGVARDFLFSPDYPWIAFAASTSGIYRTMDGGYHWSRVSPSPTERLDLDPENSHVVYAVGPSGIYKSEDLGELEMGTDWRNLTSSSVPSEAVFEVVLEENHKELLMMTVNGIFRKSESDPEWTAPDRPERHRGFSDINPIGGKPIWIRSDDTKSNRLFRSVEIEMRQGRKPFISVSDDGGKTWAPILKELEPLSRWSSGEGDTIAVTRDELMEMVGYLQEFPITDIRVDPENTSRWYGQMESAVAVTEDSGATWRKSDQGLDIPRVQTLWQPRHSGNLYAGTPAGLYLSRDKGESWEDTSLVLQDSGVIRSEIGGAGYLEAYWLGRYEGFISDEEAARAWWNESQ